MATLATAGGVSPSPVVGSPRAKAPPIPVQEGRAGRVAGGATLKVYSCFVQGARPWHPSTPMPQASFAAKHGPEQRAISALGKPQPLLGTTSRGSSDSNLVHTSLAQSCTE